MRRRLRLVNVPSAKRGSSTDLFFSQRQKRVRKNKQPRPKKTTNETALHI